MREEERCERVAVSAMLTTRLLALKVNLSMDGNLSKR